MRKINRIIISVTFVILLICIISLFLIEPIKLYYPENVIDITDIDFVKRIEQKESFILYIYGLSCPLCKEFTPLLDEALKEANIYAYKIPSDKNDQYYEEIKKQLGEKYQGTPSLYFYIDGKLKEYLVGNHEYSKIMSYLNEYKKIIES